MRRTAVRLVCVLAGVAAPLLAAPAASADPAHTPGRALPAASSAHLHAPWTDFLGRKLS